MERYEDMTMYARQLILLGEELTSSERRLVEQSYKRVIGSARTALKFFKDMEPREEYKSL
jgi:hypothetical protein